MSRVGAVLVLTADRRHLGYGKVRSAQRDRNARLNKPRCVFGPARRDLDVPTGWSRKGGSGRGRLCRPINAATPFPCLRSTQSRPLLPEPATTLRAPDRNRDRDRDRTDTTRGHTARHTCILFASRETRTSKVMTDVATELTWLCTSARLD